MFLKLRSYNILHPTKKKNSFIKKTFFFSLLYSFIYILFLFYLYFALRIRVYKKNLYMKVSTKTSYSRGKQLIPCSCEITTLIANYYFFQLVKWSGYFSFVFAAAFYLVFECALYYNVLPIVIKIEHHRPLSVLVVAVVEHLQMVLYDVQLHVCRRWTFAPFFWC